MKYFLIMVLLFALNAFAEDQYGVAKQNQEMQSQKQALDQKNAAALSHSNKAFEAEKNGTNFDNKDKADFLKKLKKNQKTVK